MSNIMPGIRLPKPSRARRARCPEFRSIFVLLLLLFVVVACASYFDYLDATSAQLLYKPRFFLADFGRPILVRQGAQKTQISADGRRVFMNAKHLARICVIYLCSNELRIEKVGSRSPSFRALKANAGF